MATIERDDAVFTEHQPMIFGLAYRMLGSVADAEDVVQETFLRWQGTDRDGIASPKSFLATVATRLSVDQLRRRQRERETYVGPWLPEPILTDDSDQASQAELAESLSLAFLTLLERLQPIERAVLLLHDVFQYSHDEIAGIVEKSPENCRQILSRSKQHLTAGRPRFRAEPARQQALLEQFLQTCRSGDVPALVAMLTEDVVLLSDGGGKVQAARKPIRGALATARALAGLTRKTAGLFTLRFVTLNGVPSVLLCQGSRVDSALNLEFAADGRISSVHIVRNPEKLARLPVAQHE